MGRGGVTDFALIRDAGSLPQQIAARTGRPRATLDRGQITAIDSLGNVTVNLGGIDRAATSMVAIPLAVGDTVRVLRQGSDTLIVGPAVTSTLPTRGTVALVPSNSYTIRVTTSIGAVDAQFPASYTPTVGDTVLLLWDGTTPVAVSQGKTGAPSSQPARTPPATPDPPPAAATSGTRTFTATGSGTWRAGEGWRRDNNGNVIQGTAPGVTGLNNGAWFYNGKIRSTLAGATVQSAKVWLGRVQGGNYGPQGVTIFRVTQARRPAGNVTYDASLSLLVNLDVGDRGWYPLPATMAQALVDSGGSLGVQATSPYVRLLGVPNTGRAGAVRITWSK